MIGEVELSGLPEVEAGFLEPMLCEPVKVVPEGDGWVFEVKLDGYRLLAVRGVGEGVTLLSRNNNSLNRKFFYIADALGEFVPEGTVLDGELVALDEKGRSNFTLLQFFRKAAPSVRYCVFDVVRLAGRDVSGLALTERKRMVRKLVEGKAAQVLVVEDVDGAADPGGAALIARVREQGLEGVIAKWKDSRYEVGQRTGAWVKHRVNKGQEFVVGGYVPGGHGFGALLVGYYRGEELIFVNRLAAGFTPELRDAVFPLIEGTDVAECPFVNLPQTVKSRWGGEGMNAEKMKECVWVRPERVVQVEFLEWSGEASLRHAKFVGVREDKDPRSVVREG